LIQYSIATFSSYAFNGIQILLSLSNLYFVERGKEDNHSLVHGKKEGRKIQVRYDFLPSLLGVGDYTVDHQNHNKDNSQCCNNPDYLLYYFEKLYHNLCAIQE
jgi:hypothetical protein